MGESFLSVSGRALPGSCILGAGEGLCGSLNFGESCCNGSAGKVGERDAERPCVSVVSCKVACGVFCKGGAGEVGKDIYGHSF